MDPIETIDHAGLKIEIHIDEDACNPREDCEPFGTMVCFHRRHNLGDKHGYDMNDFGDWPSFEAQLHKDHDIALILPLYLYDHSGLRIKIGSFNGLLPQGHAEFDSGKVGYIFATKEQVRKEHNVKRITKATLAKVYEYLKGEVETYDQYISGQVYGYVIKDSEGEDLEGMDDSCWGFYGEKYCIEQAKEAAESLAPKVQEIEAKREAEEAHEAIYGNEKGQERLAFEGGE